MHFIIVEDDADDLGFLTDAILSVKPSRITSFINGSELMFFLQSGENASSVIIMDYYLSSDNALATLSMLKNDSKFSEIPIFMLTSSLINKEECLRQGCQNYFVKPNSIDEYVDIVNEIINY
jgi:CheY-like chemotaxis protein